MPHPRGNGEAPGGPTALLDAGKEYERQAEQLEINTRPVGAPSRGISLSRNSLRHSP